MQYMATPPRKQLHEYHYTRLTLVEKHCCRYCSKYNAQDRVLDNNLKGQMKNQTLYTRRLFLLT